MLPACALAASLCMPLAAPAAWADDVSDAQAALDQAESRLKQIVEEHDALQKEADDLQVQIDGAIDGVMDAQREVQDGRARLGEMLTYEYKTGGVGVLKVLLESENLDDLLSNLHYVDSVQKAQADEIELQKQREEAFNAALDDMNDKKDQQMVKIADAEKKTEEAAAVVATAETQLSKAQDAAQAEADRLAALKAQADALAAAEQDAAAAEEPQASAPAPAPESPAQPDRPAAGGSGSTGGAAPDSGAAPAPEADQQVGWKTGAASAYGSQADGTLGATTASGAVVTESSMGVAIPMSWPNARSYLGRQVEIRYGGMTVVATVNDLGGMGGGSRALDLQPGVWKAFGASSCLDWGVRTVSYRFL
ncbi:MAG: peptidase [Slackia sp.]|nr:peptidase [Slackia sp.]